MVVWYVTDEGIPGEKITNKGLSLVDLFTTKEIAINYIKEYIDHTVKWQQGITDNYFEGYNEGGQRYILSSEVVIDG